MLSHFQFLRKYFNEQQFLKIVSGNYYGSVFYACTVWFDKIKTKFHACFRSLRRVACRDFDHQISKEDLMVRCKKSYSTLMGQIS